MLLIRMQTFPLTAPAMPTIATTPASGITGGFSGSRIFLFKLHPEHCREYLLRRGLKDIGEIEDRLIRFDSMHLSSACLAFVYPPALYKTGQLFLYLFGRKRFANVTGRPKVHRFKNFVMASLGGDHYDGNFLPFGFALQFAEQLQSVHVRHVDIGQDKSDLGGFEHLQRFPAVTSLKDFSDLYISLPQNTLQNLPNCSGSSTIKTFNDINACRVSFAL